MNDHIAIMYLKMACNISSDSYGIRVQETAFFLNLHVVFFTHKLHLNAPLHLTWKLLKRMPEKNSCNAKYVLNFDLKPHLGAKNPKVRNRIAKVNSKKYLLLNYK